MGEWRLQFQRLLCWWNQVGIIGLVSAPKRWHGRPLGRFRNVPLCQFMATGHDKLVKGCIRRRQCLTTKNKFQSNKDIWHGNGSCSWQQKSPTSNRAFCLHHLLLQGPNVVATLQMSSDSCLPALQLDTLAVEKHLPLSQPVSSTWLTPTEESSCWSQSLTLFHTSFGS